MNKNMIIERMIEFTPASKHMKRRKYPTIKTIPSPPTNAFSNLVNGFSIIYLKITNKTSNPHKGSKKIVCSVQANNIAGISILLNIYRPAIGSITHLTIEYTENRTIEVIARACEVS